jgi:hypothetical protein
MQIDLSSEAIRIIMTELESADREMTWELAALPLSATGSDVYHYWTNRQKTIRTALKELRGAI